MIDAVQRERIISAAEMALARFGYRGATASRIIESPGISRKGFYAEFRNSGQPLHIVIERLTEPLVRALDVAEFRPDAVVDAYFGWSHRYRHLLPALVADLGDPWSPIADIRRQALSVLSRTVVSGGPDPYPLETWLVVVEQTCLHLYAGPAVTGDDVDRARSMLIGIASAIAGLPAEEAARGGPGTGSP